MCIIIHKPVGAEFDPKLFENAKEHNPHGIGLMLVNRRHSRVSVIKGMFEVDQIKELYQKYAKRELCIHFRYATKGEKNKENCHPFQVLDKKIHGRDLYMMHNGTLREVEIKDTAFSDTWHFCQNYLRPLMIRDPSLIDNVEFRNLLGLSIGNPNKLLFMSGDGKVYIINKEQGTDLENGCWVSNQYSLREKYKSTTYHYPAHSSTSTSTTNVQSSVSPINPNTGSSKNKPGFLFDENLGLYYKEEKAEKIDNKNLTEEQKKYLSLTGKLPPGNAVIPSGTKIKMEIPGSNRWKHRRSQAKFKNWSALPVPQITKNTESIVENC